MQMSETPLEPVMFHQNNVTGGNMTTSDRYILDEIAGVSQPPMGLD